MKVVLRVAVKVEETVVWLAAMKAVRKVDCLVAHLVVTMAGRMAGLKEKQMAVH